MRTGSTLTLVVDNVKQTFSYSGSIEQSQMWLCGLNNGTMFSGYGFEIDNLRFYNRILTDAEITQLYGETPYGVAIVIWNPVTSEGVMPKAVIEAEQALGTGSITYYISRDGGTTFTQCTLDTATDISSQPSGTSIVFKAVITGNAILSAKAQAVFS